MLVSDKVTEKPLNPSAPLPALAVKRAGLSAAYDYYPFGMQMPARVVEDATVQCVPITKVHKVDKITDSRDLVYDFDPLASPAWPQFVPSGSNTNITYRNVSAPFVLPHYNVDMKAVTGSNLALDAKMTLDPLPSGTTGLIVDFSFVEANHPTVTGTNRNLIAKGNLGVELRNTSRPGYEGESLVLTWVNGSGSARLVVPPGKVLPGDVIRVWMHYDGPPLPASLPTSTYSQQAKFTYTSVVTHIVKPVDQQYVALSCDTDGAYAATYRYGFNGQQKDDEVKGKGNSLDFGARMYDSRLGRWNSLDPLQAKYPGNTSYGFALNSPMMLNDPDGRDARVTITGNVITYSTVFYVVGTNSEDYANNLNKYWQAHPEFAQGSYTDPKTKQVNTINLDVKYVSGTANDIERIEKGVASGNRTGDNIAILDDNPRPKEVSRAVRENGVQQNTQFVNGKWKPMGMTRPLSGHELILNTLGGSSEIAPGTGAHESLHIMGLADYYYQSFDANGNRGTTPMSGYENDIMGGNGTEMNQSHWNNFGRTALDMQQYQGSQYVNKASVDQDAQGNYIKEDGSTEAIKQTK